MSDLSCWMPIRQINTRRKGPADRPGGRGGMALRTGRRTSKQAKVAQNQYTNLVLVWTCKYTKTRFRSKSETCCWSAGHAEDLVSGPRPKATVSCLLNATATAVAARSGKWWKESRCLLP